MNTDKDKKVDLLFEDLTYKIIGAAIEVHNYLKTTGLRVGLLFNFGSSKLQKVRRIV